MSNYTEKNISAEKIGQRIRQYRTAARLTQEFVAEKVGISHKHLSRIENGYHDPHFDTIIAIAKVLNVPTDAFAQDFADDKTETFLQLIKEDIRGMSDNQLNMLRENIETIKKFNI